VVTPKRSAPPLRELGTDTASGKPMCQDVDLAYVTDGETNASLRKAMT